MEIKKNREADLDRGRPQRFLLGLLLALSCLYVALEFTLTPEDPLDDPDLLAQLSIDSELPPMMRPDNMLMLAPKAEPKPTQKLKVVDEETELEPQQEEEQVETDMDSDMEALDSEEEDITLEAAKPDDEEAVSFRVVQDLPQFPGGPTEFMKWLTRNLKYPASAQQLQQQGKVLAEFIVNKDGSITDVRIVTSLNSKCDTEVLRVLRMMPRWTAGIMDGQPCRTKVCIPVVFKL